MIRVLFGEVRLTPWAATPVLILSEAEGSRLLPIWISSAAGAAILSALEPESTDHPSTHDLLIEALATQSAVIEAVTVLGFNEGLYHAQLSVNGTEVTCRPSDGIALALRCGAPIFVAEQVLAEHGIAADDELGPGARDPESDEVEQFREFLANVRADDFGASDE